MIFPRLEKSSKIIPRDQPELVLVPSFRANGQASAGQLVSWSACQHADADKAVPVAPVYLLQVYRSK
jgi:hypothetical protein